MTTNLYEYTEFFKERVDELCLVEYRIEKQAEGLSAVAQNCIAANEAHMDKAKLRLESTSDSFDQINHAAGKVEEHIHFYATHVRLTLCLSSGKNVSGSKNDYVRIVPNTEMTMSHANGGLYPMAIKW